MKNKARIAQAIKYLRRKQPDQPHLSTLARELGLHPHYFHRLFARYASLTPKDLLQHLTFSQAAGLLRQGSSVLEAALESGLSGAGRLHDLCVSLEAASPGEIKSGGQSWTIPAGYAKSPFGRCLVAESPRGICHLSFVDPGQNSRQWSALQANWPRARLKRDDAVARRWVKRIFYSRPQATQGSPLRAFVKGTAFQLRVWRALLLVPRGHLISYGRLAARIGRPSATRAVGTAVGQNPLAYLIPCHRVIRETGAIGQYRWGSHRKRHLLTCETFGSANKPLGSPKRTAVV